MFPVEAQRRPLVPMLRELASGHPVEPERLAALADLPVEQILALLRQAPSEWDASCALLLPMARVFDLHRRAAVRVWADALQG